MTVRARSNTSIDLPVSGSWVIDVRVLDADGCDVTDDVPVVTVTLPTGGTATPTPENVSGGLYRVSYVVGTVGRYIARAVTTSHGAADFTAYVTATVAGTAMPAISDLDNYLDNGKHSYSDDDLQEALDAEAAAQRRACKVPATYPADLRSALLRRAQFHLAMKKNKLGFVEGSDGDIVRPGRDSEVRRFEAPYRRLVTG